MRRAVPLDPLARDFYRGLLVHFAHLVQLYAADDTVRRRVALRRRTPLRPSVERAQMVVPGGLVVVVVCCDGRDVALAQGRAVRRVVLMGV